MNQEALTQEERDFAEQHHAMVYKFLHDHRLPEADFYDVVIFGYLEAVQRNFRVDIEPERRNFPALARICMKTAVCREFYARWLDKRKVNYMAISMDSLISETDDEISLHDILADETQNVAREVENRDLIRRTLSVATEREYEVLALMSSGFSMAEVSQILGVSIHAIHAASCNLHAKARPLKNGSVPGLTPAQRYYEANKAECAKRDKAWREANKTWLVEYRRKYYQQHRDEINAKNYARYTAKKAAALNVSNIESGA